ncbi:MAG: hypothetical protein IT302_01300 [Dehalococcoidia bacterium]|nr:hypothetical protein [Dehalococcoidia bacterium]
MSVLKRIALAAARAIGAIVLLATATTEAGAQTPPPSPTPTAVFTPASTVTPGITPRAGSPTPAPAGTPRPAPTELRVAVTAHPLDANNVPLPLDRRPPDEIAVSWQVLPGYTGVFEVQRAIVPRGSAAREWSQFATVPASAASGGRATAGDTAPAAESASIQRCYRVRTVIAGETGPYSSEVCTALPPVSVGSVTPPVTVTVTPAPPGTGNGTPAHSAGWYELAVVVLGALGVAGAASVAAGAFTRGRA